MKNPFPDSVHQIGIPAPAGVPDRNRLEQSIALLQQWGIGTKLGNHLFEQDEATFYAADSVRRAEDFNQLAADPEVDLILCARGGYGSAQTLPLLDWKTIQKRNLPVIGYSDITAIHLAMIKKRAGIPVTAQMAASLAQSLRNRITWKSMHCALNGWEQTAKLIPFCGSDASGTLIAANLSLLVSLCGTPYLPDFHHCILILEDVNELPRILDRHLTQLLLCGILSAPSAIVFASFHKCGDPKELSSIFNRFAKKAGIPIFHGLPFGHVIPSLAFRNGTEARIQDSTLFF